MQSVKDLCKLYHTTSYTTNKTNKMTSSSVLSKDLNDLMSNFAIVAIAFNFMKKQTAIIFKSYYS